MDIARRVRLHGEPGARARTVESDVLEARQDDLGDRRADRGEQRGALVAIYLAVRLLPEKYIDLGPPGHRPINLADGPVLGFATVRWRFADRRWIGVGLGATTGC